MLFVLAAVEVIHRTPLDSAIGVIARCAFIALCVASIGVNFLSVRVPYEQWWHTLASPALRVRYEHSEPLIANQNRQGSLLNAYDFTYRASQIRGDVDLLQTGTADVAPEEFGGDRNAVGASLLAGGGLSLLGAGAVAGRSTRLRSRRREALRVRTPDQV
jgi:hypothetical protein